MKEAQKTIKHSGSARMFENEWLEKMTRSHFLIPLSILTTIALTLGYWGYYQIGFSLQQIALWSLAGFFSWTLAEYILHRFVFHMAEDLPIKKKIQYTFHGVHHEYPKDKDRIVMPPVGALLIGSVIFLLFYLTIGNYTFAFGPGFLIGYVSYAFVHYAIHAYKPPRNFLKWLWVNHSIHHYKQPDKAYGVTSPLWDYIFRTMP